MTHPDFVSAGKASLRLQDRFMSLLIAVCPNQMLWFGRGSSCLQRVSKNARSDFGEFVFLLLSIPFFKVSHLFFQFTYKLQQRELIRLGRDCVRLGGEDYSLQFDDLVIEQGSVSDTYKRLREFVGRSQRRYRASNHG